jgi:hypothetical protein
MKRKIGKFVVEFDDDGFGVEAMVGDLTQLFEDGNALRLQRGKVAIDMNEWLADPQTVEFMRVLEEKLGLPIKKDVRGHTVAKFGVLVEAAMTLDSEFKFEMFKDFIDVNQPCLNLGGVA